MVLNPQGTSLMNTVPDSLVNTRECKSHIRTNYTGDVLIAKLEHFWPIKNSWRCTAREIGLRGGCAAIDPNTDSLVPVADIWGLPSLERDKISIRARRSYALQCASRCKWSEVGQLHEADRLIREGPHPRKPHLRKASSSKGLIHVGPYPQSSR